MAEGFVGLLGFSLGVLIIGVLLRILFVPVKLVLKVIFNSVLGALILVLINLFSEYTGFFLGVNPINALTIGILGVPGLILLIILQAVF